MSDGSGAGTWRATNTLGFQASGAYLEDADFASNGIMVRTASGVYTTRFATGTLNEIAVVNPDGGAGDITFSLPDLVYLGANSMIAAMLIICDFSTIIDNIPH
jgi:hypothetical protein